MPDAKLNNKKQMPKRKGGTRFPRYNLKDALGWATKLVAKTHITSAPADVIFSAVLTSRGTTAEIKVSSLKQYGFIEGSSAAYNATELAKKISASPAEEILSLYRKAALNPATFKALFETFHGDKVSKSHLKQRLADLKVHPEETSACADIYIQTMLVAELITVNNDEISHVSSSEELIKAPEPDDRSRTKEIEDEIGDNKMDVDAPGERELSGSPRAVFNVKVSLDSSLDTEKLEKQLRLLKRYGAIRLLEL